MLLYVLNTARTCNIIVVRNQIPRCRVSFILDKIKKIMKIMKIIIIKISNPSKVLVYTSRFVIFFLSHALYIKQRPNVVQQSDKYFWLETHLILYSN